MSQVASPDLAPPTRAPALARIADGYTFAAAVVLGVWTVVYQLALALTLTRNQAMGLAVVILVAGGLWNARARTLRPVDMLETEGWVPTAGPALVALAGLVALGGAFAGGGEVVWTVFSGGVVIVGLAGLARSRRAPAAAPPAAGIRPQVDVALIGAAVLIGLLLTLGVVRPDTDDVDLVSRSAYVEAEAGALPTGDVIYDPPRLPFLASIRHQPSWEPFVGVVAALLPLRAGDVTYVLFPPLLAIAGVAAIYLLARELSPAHAALATLAAVVFLALDGGTHRAFGNFSFVRIWQGKAVMVFFLVPLCWRYGIALLDRPHARAAIGWIASLGAIVGAARTGMVIAPGIVVVVLIAALVLRRNGVVAAILVGGIFPAAVVAEWFSGSLVGFGSVVTALVEFDAPESATSSATPWMEIISTAGVGVVAAAAMCGAAVLASRRAATAVMAGAITAFGLTAAAPLVFERGAQLMDSSGLEWRALWFLPVPALVGMLVSKLGALAAGRFGPRWAGVGVVGLLVAALLVGGGRPTWDGGNGAEIRWFAWKWPEAAIEPARALIDLRPTGVVVAPFEVQQAVAVIDRDLHPVIARFLDTKDPAFHRELRYRTLAAYEFGMNDDDHASDFARAIELLGVTHACVPPEMQGGRLDDVLADSGFTPQYHDGWCMYWLRQIG